MTDSIELKNLDVNQLLSILRAREETPVDVSPGDFDPETVELGAALREFDSAKIVEVVNNEQKVIYGVDDRQDLFQITDAALQADADGVVALFRNTSIVDNGNGTSGLVTQLHGTANNLCANEPFRNQPVGAFCSGFLVAPDVVATAGHCVDANDVTNVRFVFGFRMINATTAQTTVSNNEIYRGVRLLGRRLETTGSDWALVQLDRRVPNHRPARIRTAGRIPDNQAVHVIGHPSGLPIKVAGGANVRDNTPGPFFVANLDTYGGNSGSPVFNSTTHQVEGILVRGERDFTTTTPGCMVSLVCPTTGCRGEDCTRITQVAGKNVLGDTAVGPPAVADLQNRVILGWAGTDVNHRLNVMSSSERSVWTNKVTLGDTSPVGVSLCVFNNLLFMAWSGTGNQQLNVMSSSNGLQWSNKVTLNETSSRRPVLTAHGGRLVLGWVGTDSQRRLNILSSPNGQNWVDKRTLSDTSIDAPALASFQSRLYIGWTGTNTAQNLNVMSSGDFGASWQNKRVLSDTSIAGPGLWFGGDRLLLSWAGRDSQHRINVLGSVNGIDFENKLTLDDTSDSTPGLIRAYGLPAVVWTGRDSAHHLNVMTLFL
jgi:hypothetical protein